MGGGVICMGLVLCDNKIFGFSYRGSYMSYLLSIQILRYFFVFTVFVLSILAEVLRRSAVCPPVVSPALKGQRNWWLTMFEITSFYRDKGARVCSAQRRAIWQCLAIWP